MHVSREVRASSRRLLRDSGPGVRLPWVTESYRELPLGYRKVTGRRRLRDVGRGIRQLTRFRTIIPLRTGEEPSPLCLGLLNPNPVKVWHSIRGRVVAEGRKSCLAGNVALD